MDENRLLKILFAGNFGMSICPSLIKKKKLWPITRKINVVVFSLCTVSRITVDSSSARAKLALGGARERGCEAGLFSVFPPNFLFFFKNIHL